jgi:hypothetical protein
VRFLLLVCRWCVKGLIIFKNASLFVVLSSLFFNYHFQINFACLIIINPDLGFMKNGRIKKRASWSKHARFITTEANEVLEPVHDRMPVILSAEDYDLWLDEKEKNTERLQNLLVPFPASEMASHAIRRSVNTPNYNSPELISEINSK